MGLEHLYLTEQETEFITSYYLKGITDNYPEIIDVFFKLPHFFGELEPPDSPYGTFQSFCLDSYIQAPYTFWIIFDLYQKGYYLEAITLYRHSIEIYVQLKYFHKYNDRIAEHLTGNWISFKKLFMEFTSEEFYSKFYGHLLSSFAHGKLAKNIFRYENISSPERSIIMGCKFNSDNATYIMNQNIPLLFGYLNHYHIFFPKNDLQKDQVINNRYEQMMAWLKLAMDDHKKTFTQSLIWYKDMDKLIYP